MLMVLFLLLSYEFLTVVRLFVFNGDINVIRDPTTWQALSMESRQVYERPTFCTDKTKYTKLIYWVK